MSRVRILALFLILFGAGLGFAVFSSESPDSSLWYRPFKLGLDLKGGTHLVYQADVTDIPPADVPDAMASLRGVIERRVNLFGVSEALVQTAEVGLGQNRIQRLIVDLPGVTDVAEAIKTINKTPVLEFKTVASATSTDPTSTSTEPVFITSSLTGRYLKKAQVQFVQGAVNPSISIEFDDEGGDLFAELTRDNIGKPIGIFLDGELISAPNVNEEIVGGQAEITGQFTIEEAKQLVRDLNLGALPVPISLVSTQAIGATLGENALDKGLQAGMYGFLAIALFLILWYRLPGLIAVVSLMMYITIMLAIFKLIPITLTAAGIAGFILSIGTATDANVLIFERMKEELRKGKSLKDSMHDGFDRAWTSIRDSNLAIILSSIILFWFGTSSIEGFALTLGTGIVVSLFTAITVTRTFLFALGFHNQTKVVKFLFGKGSTK